MIRLTSIQWHGLVGEASVKLLDTVVLSEQPGRFLARGKRHRQIARQAARRASAASAR